MSALDRVTDASVDETQAAWAEWSDEVAGVLPPNEHRALAPAHDVGDALDDEFWNARPVLARIRQAAHARQRSAVAVLYVVLARVSALVPHTLELPPIVGTTAPLNLFVALVAAPGVGKSGAMAIGTELLRAPVDLDIADQIPVGSGEGLVEILFGLVKDDSGKCVKRQVRFNVFAGMDEGAAIADLTARSGSTLLSTWRTIWTGGTLGNANASEERKRIVPAGQYVYGFVLAIQEERARVLLDDAPSGTPQRFEWGRATDPTIPDNPPPWPGPLDWRPPTTLELRHLVERTNGPYVRHRLRFAPSIEAELRLQDRARARGEVVTNTFDAHAGLARMKIAALLTLLDGRVDVNEEDWYLAGRIKKNSDTTRSEVLATVAAVSTATEVETSTRLARRRVHAEKAVDQHRKYEQARRMSKKVHDDPDGDWSPGKLRKGMSSAQREDFTEIFDIALGEDWLIVTSEPGQGTDKRAVRPGAKRP